MPATLKTLGLAIDSSAAKTGADLFERSTERVKGGARGASEANASLAAAMERAAGAITAAAGRIESALITAAREHQQHAEAARQAAAQTSAAYQQMESAATSSMRSQAQRITEVSRLLPMLSSASTRTSQDLRSQEERTRALTEAQRQWAAEARGAAGAGKLLADAIPAEELRARWERAFPKAAEAQRSAIETAQAYTQAFERAYQADIARIKEGQARGFLTPAEAEKAAREAAIAYDDAMIRELDRRSARGGLNGKDGQAAFTEIAGSLKNVEDSGRRAGLGLGQMKESMGSVMAQAMAANPIVGRFTNAVGTLALGTGITLGVMAGLTAIAWGYQKLTEQARKEREEIEKSVQAVRDRAQAERDGATGELARQIATTTSEMEKQRGEAQRLSQWQEELTLTGLDMGLAAGMVAKRAAEQTEEWKKNAAAIEETTKALARLNREAARTAEGTAIGNIATLISSGHASSALQDAARRRIQEAQQTLAAGTDINAMAEAARVIQQLQGAFDGLASAQKKAGNASKDETIALREALEVTQRTTQARLTLTAARQEAEARHRGEIELLYIEAGRRSEVMIELESERQRRAALVEALADESGVLQTLLPEKFADIEAERQRALALDASRKAIEGVNAAMQRAPEGAQAAVNSARQAELERQAAAAGMTVDEYKSYLAQLARLNAEHAKTIEQVWENTLRRVQDIFHDGFQRLFTGEHLSWQTFADGIVDMMASAAAAVATVWITEMLGVQRVLDALKNGESIGDALGKLSGPGKILGSAGAGFGIGYGIGTMTGSKTLGVAGGALGGAAAGFMMAGPVGAVVGGLAGAVGGLLGAGKAQKEAAERLKQAAEAMRTSVQSYQQFAAGNQNPFMQQWLDNLNRAEQLRKQANDSMPGKKAESQRNEFLRQIDVARAEAIDRIKSDFSTSIEQQLNALKGPAGEYANKLKEIEDAYADNVRTAKAIFGPLTDLSQVEELRRRQLEQLAAAEAELHRTRAEDLEIRRLVATGQTEEAARRRVEIDQRRALLKAQQEGWTEQEIAELRYVQGLERETEAKERATKAAEDAARAAEDFTQRFLRLTGRGDEADRRALDQRQADERKQFGDAPAIVKAQMEVVHQFEQAELAAKQAAEAQIAAIEAQTKAQLAAFDRQIEATQQGIESARENARQITERLESTRRAVEALTQFRQGLRVGEMSPLSPEAQLAEARRLFEEGYQKAAGGDAAAAAAFPALAQDLLQKSRAFNASSTGYVEDFARVEQFTAALEGQFGDQLTIEEQQLAEAQKQTEALEAQLETLRAQKEAAQAAAQEMIARLRSQEYIGQETQNRVVAAIEAQRDAAIGPAEELLSKLDQLRTSQETAIASLAQSQFSALLENRNAVATAAQAQIDAVRAGASLQEQAQLQQVAKLEQQRLDYNTHAIQQIQELAAVGGTSQEQLAALERQRQATDAGMQQQIAALQGLGGKLDRWTQPTINVTVTVNVDGSGGTGTGTGGGSQLPNAPGSGGRPIPEFAIGGYHTGGLRLVGEDGPELEATGPARYYSAADTRAILSPASSEATVAELRQQNQKLEKLVMVTIAANRGLADRLDRIIAAQGDVAEELMLSRFKKTGAA